MEEREKVLERRGEECDAQLPAAAGKQPGEMSYCKSVFMQSFLCLFLMAFKNQIQKDGV